MAGNTNTIAGKAQQTFHLHSEILVNKYRVPVRPVAEDAATDFDAGEIIYVPSALAVTGSRATAAQKGFAKEAGSDWVAKDGLLGVSFEAHTSTLDECAGSGLCTLLVGEHEGRTKKFTGATFAPGDELYVADGGLFTRTTTGKHVAYVERFDGVWLTYRWIGEGLN